MHHLQRWVSTVAIGVSAQWKILKTCPTASAACTSDLGLPSCQYMSLSRITEKREVLIGE